MIKENNKVLIADDDPYILMSLEFLMKKSGFEVFIARDGNEAWQILQNETPKVAVLDIMMPEMDGYDLSKKIKATPSLESCAIIFISAKTQKSNIDRAYELGASLFISKPFSTKFLVQKVNEFMNKSNHTSMAYRKEYLNSIQNPEEFWMEKSKVITWFKNPEKAVNQELDGMYTWYKGGKLNLSYLCLDYHIENGRGNQNAIIYDSPVSGKIEYFTYRQLRHEVSKVAGSLLNIGIQKGDRVIIYMPMIAEAVISMLACARIGAVHSVVFGGFAPAELATRLDDAKPKIILTANFGIEVEKKIFYKPLVDEAINLSQHKPSNVIVYLRNGESVTMIKGRDIDWDTFTSDGVEAPFVPLDASDPLYLLYTSGTTGKPKAVLRDQTSAVALKYSMNSIYNTNPGDVFWAASDVGWVVGHSYIVYGPLLQGCTSILFEGKPIKTPDAFTFWRIIEQHKVNVLFTAPTSIRAIKKEDSKAEGIKKHDLSSLNALYLAGERCDPPTFDWIKNMLQKPVIDHWWQTESGWPMLGVMMGIEALEVKSGSSNLPIAGYNIQILDDDGNELGMNEEGNVVVKLPLPPGCLQTLYNDHDGYVEKYLSRFPGYYLSGDGGYKDKDGYFFIMGRIDDVINVAGHRLSTGEMEEIIASHPSIAECAVVGIADELRGQVPVGFVVLKDGENISEEDLEKETIDLVRNQIGAVAFYRKTLKVARLPKTRSGKILRKIIRFIADGKPFAVPSTIDDPTSLEEIENALKLKNVGKAFE